MNAAELEQRTAEAEQNPSLIRQLIADFKAYKDAQLSDLTQQVNQAQADAVKSLADITAERDALKQTIAAFIAADEETKAKMLADAQKTERQKALEAAQAELAAAQAKLAALANTDA